METIKNNENFFSEKKEIIKQKEPLIEKFQKGEELNENEYNNILQNQILKIGKARKQNYTRISMIEDRVLRNDMKNSLYRREQNEVKGKINNNQPIQSLSVYLPNQLKNSDLRKYTLGEKKDFLVSTKEKNLGDSRGDEKSDTKEMRRENKGENTIQKELSEEPKKQVDAIEIFFQKIIAFLKNIFQGRFGIFSPPENTHKKEETKKKEKPLEKIIEAKRKDNNTITFDIDNQSLEIDINNINEVYGREEEKCKNLPQTLITLGKEKYLIQKGRIYHWNHSMAYLEKGIQEQYSYKEQKEINKAILSGGEKEIKDFSFSNYEKNIKILFAFIFLGIAKNTKEPSIKQRNRKRVEDIFDFLKIPNTPTDSIDKNYKKLLTFLRKGNYVF